MTKNYSEKKRQVLIERNTTHGMSKDRAYSNWKEMKKRCFNKNNKRYKDYAERGITVHPDFVDNFPAWLAEIGPKPDGEGWSVGRIDNNSGYVYGNMRWETHEQQARNHTMQVNNTSGYTGIKIRTRTISGGEYTSVTACWNDISGKRRTKDFSADKFGLEQAVKMAVEFRKSEIEKLNALGAGYAYSHGSAK